MAWIKVPDCNALCMGVLLLKGASHLAAVWCKLEKGAPAVNDAGYPYTVSSLSRAALHVSSSQADALRQTEHLQ